jgi:hypothetical protein
LTSLLFSLKYWITYGALPYLRYLSGETTYPNSPSISFLTQSLSSSLKRKWRKDSVWEGPFLSFFRMMYLERKADCLIFSFGESRANCVISLE